MKKFISVLLILTLMFALSASVFAARKITDEEKGMLADMKGKEVLGRKIAASDLAALENFLMNTDRPLSQTDIDAILANIDEVISIILMSGATDLKNLPKDAMDKIMKILDSTTSIADLSVSISSAASSTPSITITSKEGVPVVIAKETIIKKTGANVSFEFDNSISIIMIFIAAAFGLAVVVRRNGRKPVGYGA